MNVEKQELKKNLDTCFRKINRLPGINDLFNQFNGITQLKGFFDRIFPENGNNSGDDDHDHYVEELNEYLEKLNGIFSEVEAESRKLEAGKNHEMRVFNFNVDLIMEHAKKIESVKHRIIYLEYILKEYPAHETLYMNLLNDRQNQLLAGEPEFFKNLFQFLANALNYLNEEDEGFVLPKLRPGFREQILVELNFLYKIKNEENTTDMLEAINNPSGTRKKYQSVTSEQPDEPEDDLLSDLIDINEVCKILKVSKVTIHNWRKSGKINSHRIGRKVYYRKSEIVKKLLEKGSKKR